MACEHRVWCSCGPLPCTWSERLPKHEEGSIASLTEALRRCSVADPSCTNVRAMMGLVDVVFAFGPSVSNALGHTSLLQRVEQYVNNFSCPECHPWEFGMSRIYLATVLGMSADSTDDDLLAVKVDGAKTLLACVRDAMVSVQSKEDTVECWCTRLRTRDSLTEVLEAARLTERMIARGRDHPWYRM